MQHIWPYGGWGALHKAKYVANIWHYHPMLYIFRKILLS